MDTRNYSLRLTASDPELAQVWVRRQHFAIGRPIEFDDASPRIAALEYALGAMAGEVVNGLRVFASRRRIQLAEVEALITAETAHEAAYLEVVGESGVPRIVGVHVKVFAASDDEAGLRRAWSELLDRLPLVCTLRVAVPMRMELLIGP